MPPRFDPHSEIIQVYRHLQEAGYMLDIPEGEVYREQPLYSCTITEVQSSPLTSIRTRSVANTIPEDYCSFIVLCSGGGHWVDKHAEYSLAGGDIVFIEAARPFTFHFTESYQAISFNLPRTLLSKEGVIPVRHGTVAKSNDELLKLLRQHIQDMSSYNGAYASQVELDLLGLFCDRFCASQLTMPLPPTLAFVKQLIKQHALDEEFSIDWLVRRSRGSRRYLFKLFEAERLTLKQYIQKTQLHEAFKLLTDPHQMHLKIGDIALHSGFKTQAHFARLFKQRFHITPKALRNELMLAEAAY